ncbi:hypothetical protein [Mycobacteroides salmoniphilum]|uniref:hypothetical protein n=1 Tax=Mycobacteroides salmoniphilum TaxID=404941 RepID=UPI0010655DC0|nr:hypothetical protein [Mycobacteroides salmoniphilum]TDZ81173.1 hypothetical protein DE4586_01120 [Mycobacteroides salmoniphilum]TDZ88673.1 hypothetical protein DE4587_01036 [Mycobacteroides salmoniphilum]
MDARTGDNHDAVADATAWIADATRRLAELDGGSDGQIPAGSWSEGGSALEQLRAAVAHRIAALPRRGKPISTAIPGITVSHLALAKALTSSLAAIAAEASAAIAAVDVEVEAQAVTALRINLVAIGAAERDHTYLDDGDTLRKRAAAVVNDIIGIEPPTITVTWEDIVLPSY